MAQPSVMPFRTVWDFAEDEEDPEGACEAVSSGDAEASPLPPSAGAAPLTAAAIRLSETTAPSKTRTSRVAKTLF